MNSAPRNHGLTPHTPWFLLIGLLMCALIWDPALPAATSKRLALLVLGAAAFFLNRRATTTSPSVAADGTAQTGTAQSGTAQTGTAQTGTAQTGTAQTGTALTSIASATTALIVFGLWSGILALFSAPANGEYTGFIAAGLLLLSLDSLAPAARYTLFYWMPAILGLALSLLISLQFVLGARGTALHGLMGNNDWAGLVLASCFYPLVLHPAWSAGAGTPENTQFWSHFLAWIRASPWPRLALRGAAAMFLLGACLLTHSRTALFSLILSSPLALVAIKRARVATALYGFITLGGPLALAAAPLPSSQTGIWGALAGRMWIARCSLDGAFATQPFGTGPGAFANAFLPAQGQRLSVMAKSHEDSHLEAASSAASKWFENATTAHGDLLHAFTTLGPMGLVLLGALLVLAYWQAASSRHIPITLTLGTIGIAGVGDSTLLQPAVLIVFLLAVAALPTFGPVNNAKQTAWSGLNTRFPAIGRPLVTGALLLFVSLNLANLVRATLSQHIVYRALHESMHSEDSLSQLEWAAAIAPNSEPVRLQVGLAQLARGNGSAALFHLTAANSRQLSVGTQVAIGNAHFLNGDLSEAKRAFEYALSLNPSSFRAHLNLARTLLEQHRQQQQSASDKLDILAKARTHWRAARRPYPFHPKVMALRDELQKAEHSARSAAP